MPMQFAPALSPRAPRASQSGIPIFADTTALTRLSRDLMAAAPEAWKACRVAMRAEAEVVAEDARQRVDYSSRIEWSIKVRVRPGSVKIIAGGDAAPDASPIENQGKGFVRHPVFGNREVWTAKNSHPAFLAPALEAHKEEVLLGIEAAVVGAVNMALPGAAWDV